MLIFPAVIMMLDGDDDIDFMKRIYEKYYDLMLSTAYRILNNQDDAQDAVHNAFIKLCKKVSLLRTFSCYILQSYVVSTIRHAAIDLCRKEKYDRFVHMEQDDPDALAHQAPSTGEIATRRIENERLMQAIQSLPQTAQDYLRFKYFENLSDEEIAEITGIKPGSVRTAIMRARKLLREKLEEDK